MERELEVKVLDIDLQAMEEKIIRLGGKLIANEYQINTLIDSRDKPIKSYLDGYLRIRETRNIETDETDIKFTLKKNINLDGLRDNEEFNVDIGNGDMMLKILGELGLDKVEVAHKKRKSYELMGARFDFDKWDSKIYPNPYMEIEVQSREDLQRIISELNIPETSISTKSIMELRKEIK